MEVAKLLLLVTMVIAGSALTPSGAETIITVNRARVFTKQEIDKALSGEVEPKDTARYLARCDGDDDTKFDGVKLSTLLSLNSYELERDCSMKVIVQRHEICRHLGIVLQAYCKFCVSALERKCANSLASIMKNNIDVEFLLDFRQRIDNYIEKAKLRIDYPIKMFVIDYLYSLSREERAKHERFCKDVDEIMKREAEFLSVGWRLPFLDLLKDQDGKLYSAMVACVHVSDGKY